MRWKEGLLVESGMDERERKAVHEKILSNRGKLQAQWKFLIDPDNEKRYVLRETFDVDPENKNRWFRRYPVD